MLLLSEVVDVGRKADTTHPANQNYLCITCCGSVLMFLVFEEEMIGITANF